ncbi:MAG: hypothetical protein ACTSV1_07640 [Alphaproteobacteria bacterium]
MTVRTQINATDKRRRERRASVDRRARRDRRAPDRSPGIGTLFIMCLFGLAALGLFVFFETDVGTKIEWRKMFFPKDRDTTSFKMGGVSLGMSAKDIRLKHSNLNLNKVASGESIGSFSFDGANYTLWFVEIDGRDKAYRMRYDQAFTSRSEIEILDSIGDKHGKPGTSECTKAGVDARKCHFQWWPSGGIALNVSTTETTKPGTKRRTEVTMIATDTYLDGKRMRLRKLP